MKAIAQGRLDEVESLLASGVDPNASADSGTTPLMLAWRAPQGPTAVGLLVVAGARIDTVNASGKTALMIATMSGRPDVAKELIRRGANVNLSDPKGRTALTLAAEVSSDASLIDALVTAGADVNARVPPNGTTPVMLAAASNNASIVLRLLDAGADVEARDRKDETAAFYAVGKNAAASLRALADRGAQLDVQGKRGPLAALATGPGRTACLEILRERGVTIPTSNPAVRVGG